MSCTDSKNFSEPQIIKIDCSEDKVTIAGKPCIDFQPDDRWQIKDDENSENKNSKSSVNELKSNANGRRSLRLRNSKSTDSNSAINGENGESGSENEKDSDKQNENLDAVENHSKRKRHNSSSENMPDCNTNKKLKVDDSCETSDKRSSENDLSKETVDGPYDKMPNLSPSNSNSNDKTEKETKESEKNAVITDSDKGKNNSDSNEGKEEDDDDCEVVSSQEGDKKNENHSEDSSNLNGAVNTKDNDIEIININDDKKSDSEESDSEIQIINPEEDIIKKVTADPLKNDLQDGNYALSAGFPFYNSLKEKIKNFKAGEYKPVKFPHTGTLLLGENEVIIESPSLLVPLLIKEADEFPKLDNEEKKSNTENNTNTALLSRQNISKRNFFQSSVGQFLINLGMSRVNEWYHRDMKRSKLKQLKSAKETDLELEESAKEHDKKHEELKKINAAFNFRLHRCKFCEFKTESLIVLESHYLTPHTTPRREFKCNFCDFMTRDPTIIAQHYDKSHQKKAVLDSCMPFHECIFCTFSTHLKNKLNAHMNRCKKHFIPSQNLSPPFDFEFPGVTTKPVTINDVIGHRRLLLSSAKNPRMPIADDNNPNSIYARKKLASVLTKLTGPNAAYDMKNPNIMKQLMANQSQVSLSGSNLQLPPGLVITRPRGQVPPVRTPVGRFQGPRGMPQIRGIPPRRGPPYTTTITNAASQLASSGISITPVTRPNAGGVKTNTLPGTKNVTLTPISTATNRTVSQKPGPPQPVALFTNMAGSGTMLGQPQARLPANMHIRPLRPAPPYQRLSTPPSQVVKGSSGNTFVVCEICDSYIKDLEELRTHMNWVHKVKIHPKMLVSRPPLNCQKCHWRFFTDQGLERHLLGAHGLVTTNMQEMANKNQDGGRCIICGAVFTYKLVSHMTQVHKVTLKPAHLSYKCTVCTATFTLYRLFESHVYNVHSGSAKRSSEDSSSSSSSEPAAKKAAVADTGPRKCRDCGVVTENMHDHLVKQHMKECVVKLCRIEKCEKCLNSSDEMIIIRMSDFGLDDELDDSDEDSSEEDDSSEEEADDSSKAEPKKTGDQKKDNSDSEIKEEKEPVTS